MRFVGFGGLSCELREALKIMSISCFLFLFHLEAPQEKQRHVIKLRFRSRSGLGLVVFKPKQVTENPLQTKNSVFVSRWIFDDDVSAETEDSRRKWDGENRHLETSWTLPTYPTQTSPAQCIFIAWSRIFDISGEENTQTNFDNPSCKATLAH